MEVKYICMLLVVIPDISIGGKRPDSFSREITPFSPLCMVCQEHQVYIVYIICIIIKNYLCVSGRHSCLWCHICTDQMKIPKNIRGLQRERSLDTLAYDYQQFLAAGGDIRNAKKHNNVIGPYFFDIPLDQVHNYRAHDTLTVTNSVMHISHNLTGSI